jgi:tetratricopeptide (TPR) repeat protein
VQATLMLARMVFYEGQCQRCIEITGRLLDRALELPYSDRRGMAQNLAVSAYFGPAPLEDAFRLHEQAAAIVEEGIVSQAFLALGRGALLAMQGRAEESRAEAERGERMLLEVGVPALLANTSQLRGEAERFLGRPDLAEEYFRQGVERWDDLGETGFNSTATALRAIALCELDRFDEAETLATRSRELASEDDFASHAAWRMAQARVLTHRGDHEAALRLADEAIAINGKTDFLTWQAESDEVRGIVLAAAERAEEALASFRSAMERFVRKGVVPSAARVRDRIAALDD